MQVAIIKASLQYSKTYLPQTTKSDTLLCPQNINVFTVLTNIKDWLEECTIFAVRQ